MKIGVFGGTFNPIHVSHIHLAKEYKRRLELDRVIFIPTYTPPHKPVKGLARAEDRLEMCRIATAVYPAFEVNDYEVLSGGKSYTYRTLSYLRELYPGAEFYLIMGGDMFLTVQDWRRAADIFEIAALCVAQRELGELSALDMHKEQLEQQGARCVLLSMEPHPLSSSSIRKSIGAGEDVKGLLPTGVWEYIRDHGLYRK